MGKRIMFRHTLTLWTTCKNVSFRSAAKEGQESDANKLSSESEAATPTPKTPKSSRLDDRKFFGDNFSLELISSAGAQGSKIFGKHFCDNFAVNITLIFCLSDAVYSSLCPNIGHLVRTRQWVFAWVKSHSCWRGRSNMVSYTLYFFLRRIMYFLFLKHIMFSVFIPQFCHMLYVSSLKAPYILHLLHAIHFIHL